MGSFLLQRHLLPADGLHGRFPVKRLQASSPDWLERCAGGTFRAPDPRRWAYIDTETSGLAGGTGTFAFLIGVGSVASDGFRVRLFFMRDFDEEAAMLESLAGYLGRFDALLSFNGASFDLPLLQSRFRMQRMPDPFSAIGHADMLHPARRIWKGRMPNCRLGTLESELFGVRRRGDIPGAEIPQAYFDFLRTGRSEALRRVLRHNVLDIASLACVAHLLMEAFAAGERARLRHGSELLGLARWLARWGDGDRAIALHRRAIRAGLPLPDRCASLWEAAHLERRAGNNEQQVRLLRDLSRIPSDYRAKALIDLAKHYEHRTKDYRLALRMTRSAKRIAPSPEIDHREKRLLRKAAARAPSGQPTPRPSAAARPAVSSASSAAPAPSPIS